MKIKATFKPRKDGTFGKIHRIHGDLEINSDGTVDVSDEYAATLIATGNFTENYAESELVTPMLITNGEETIDLMPKSKADLRDIMKKAGITMLGNPGEAKIREAIVQKFSSL